MAEIENKNNNKWQFSFLVAFSLFLIVTFVLYLPLRFRSGLMDHNDEQVMMDGNSMMEDDHGKHAALYQEENEVKEGLVVNLSILDVPYATHATGRPLFFDFWVNEMPNRTPVSLDQLEVSNTKLMHVIGVRSDMNGFFHLHPEPVSIDPNIPAGQRQMLSTEFKFEQPGRYKIWSEIKKDGINHVFGHPEISVVGDGPVENKEVSFARNVIIGSYQLSLFVKEPVSRGQEQRLSFDLHTLTGQELKMENYLGVPMHLTVIKDDWSQFIHTHPGMDESDMDMMDSHGFGPVKVVRAHEGAENEKVENVKSDETADFNVVFPTAGRYKVFAQFRPEGAFLPEGEAMLATFWIEVQEKAPPVVSSQIWLVLVSVILIIILSLAVSRYLKVKPVQTQS